MTQAESSLTRSTISVIFRICAKQWNKIPTNVRALPKATFKKKIQMILFKILENEDSYKPFEFIILLFIAVLPYSIFSSNPVLS